MPHFLKTLLIATAVVVSGCGGGDSCGSKIAFGHASSINCGNGDLSMQVNGNDAAAELVQKIKNSVAAVNAGLVINVSDN
jgi:hypothetical protein